jgi:multiple sugar transport system substrate-binding protein
MVIDHPHVGSASVEGTLLPLETYLPKGFMSVQRENGLGKSFDSYWYNGHCWALPIDAAAQVAAFRKDLCQEYHWEIPDDMRNLEQAAKALPQGVWIAVPLCPTDCWCVFLSVCGLYADGDFFSTRGVDVSVGEWALDQMHSWKPFLYPNSYEMNAIQMLEHLGGQPDIIYAPYVFGYSNYARKGWRNNQVYFGHSPGCEPSRHTTLLGGAGLAISAKTSYLTECLEFMQFVLSEESQKGLYFQEQGQPAHLGAWMNPALNEQCAYFFSETLDTLKQAYMRPRFPGFNQFQEKAAAYLHHNLLAAQKPRDTIMEINKMYQNIVDGTIPAH